MPKISSVIEENVISTPIHKWKDGNMRKVEDHLAIETPLSIQICQEGTRDIISVAVTMRTPGDDTNLALGFLMTEGIIQKMSSIHHISHPSDHIIRVFTNEPVSIDTTDRNFYMTSSCGVCGKASVDKIFTQSIYPITPFGVKGAVLLTLKNQISQEQSLFTMTGGIHAAAIFDKDGKLINLMEDVGRHNALDKVIGSAQRENNLPLNNRILLLSGRASFELIQKATMAGISTIVAIGAPSSLAVELADKNGQTLIGFVKSEGFNIYTGQENIS